MMHSLTRLYITLACLLTTSCGHAKETATPESAADASATAHAHQVAEAPPASSDVLPPNPLTDGARGYIGVVSASTAVDVGPLVGGRMSVVLVRIGANVVEGQILARLEAREFEEELRESQASLRSAQASTHRARVSELQAQKRLATERALVEAGYATSESVADAETALSLAQADARVAYARLEEVRVQLQRTQTRLDGVNIRAPSDGVIAAQLREASEFVGASEPVFRLISQGNPWVRFAAPEGDLVELEPGTLLTIQVFSSEQTITVPGVLRRRAPEVDAATSLVLAEAELDVSNVQDPNVLRVGLEAAVLPSVPRG